MKQGTLVYDHATDRYDIRFDLDCYYGGLDWYLVGIRTDDLQGLRVRM